MSREIAVVPTKAIDTSASRTRSDSSVAVTSSRTRAADSPGLRTVADTSTLIRAMRPAVGLRREPARSDACVVRVCPDDLSNEPVTHHVRLVQIVEADALDSRQDALDLYETRLLAPRKIDLRLVACDDGL